MKGIILAGGTGTRLHPATLAINKQLLPIYDKPMIYYPMSVLMLAGIHDILIIASPDYVDNYRRLFEDGSSLGIRVAYMVQPKPEGLPQAFTLGREFIGGDSVMLVLGDNLFFGANMTELLARASSRRRGATIFSYRVDDPSRYGVVDFDESGNAVGLEEKPLHPRSNQAVTGLYVFDGTVADRAASLRPSARGELEITDLIREYLLEGSLAVELMGRGFAWLDTGTHDSLLEAGEFVRTIQKRQGIQIACLEEIAYRQGFITADQARSRGRALAKTAYGQAILTALEQRARPRM
ncbi:glucose-1-phosphate thymidylyltransferase RfbA [Sphingomonas sp. MMS12-HWE2-04]|uniref:glucose-1-phosphate thymidylyltransferase RfbA n=1 Tax=Sphingomonas sp. MMS12-HWE2-04 TaxID=3234199 RepID=UPI00384C32C4